MSIRGTAHFVMLLSACEIPIQSVFLFIYMFLCVVMRLVEDIEYISDQVITEQKEEQKERGWEKSAKAGLMDKIKGRLGQIRDVGEG